MLNENILVAVDYSTIYIYTLGLLTKVPQTLKYILEDIVSKSDISINNIDFTSLSSINVNGYSVSRKMKVSEALDPLLKTYRFDLIEEDNKLKSIVYNNASSLKTISSTEIGVSML